MSDIVERLRTGRIKGSNITQVVTETHVEAANHIEALERKLELARVALGPFSELADEVEIVARQCRTVPEYVAKACQWEDLLRASQALKEINND